MSCNGCRVLRKGCSDDCMLRHCLVWIENPQAQAHATVFVAKFFGRAALMSFVSSVPIHQRSAMFQSLLYEAVGRTINPVNGAMGLLWTGNWHVCRLGVEKVFQGGAAALTPIYMFPCLLGENVVDNCSSSRILKRKLGLEEDVLAERAVVDGGGCHQAKKQRAATPSEESETTTLGSSALDCAPHPTERKLLTLFF